VSTAALALRTYVRYLVPLTLLSALVFAPVLWFVLRLPVPSDAAFAKQLLRVVWVLAASAWIAQYLLVGAVAPAVRAIASGEPLSQVRSLGRGFLGLARMLLPCLVAIVAIVIGSMALVLPGLALLALLALTGASTERGLPAPLLDSIAVARTNLRSVAITVVAIIVVDLAIVGVAYLVVAEPLPKKPAPAQLAAFRELAQIVTISLAAASPIAASVLAAIRVRARP